MDSASHQIVFAEEKRVKDPTAAAESDTQDQRDFVHRRDAEDDPAVAVRVGENVGVRDEWLDTEDTLRLRATDFRAPVAQLKGEVPSDDRLTGRRMLSGYPPSGAPPDSVARDAKGRSRIDVDPGDAFPLAGDRQGIQVL